MNLKFIWLVELWSKMRVFVIGMDYACLNIVNIVVRERIKLRFKMDGEVLFFILGFLRYLDSFLLFFFYIN